MKTVLKIMIIMIILSMTMSISVFASTLTLKVTSDQAKYELGDKVSQEVLDYISEKTNLFKTLFKVFVIANIPRNDSGKIKYKELGK